MHTIAKVISGSGYNVVKKVPQSMSKTAKNNAEKVVIQFGDRTLKGYLEFPVWDTIEDLISNPSPSSRETFRVRLLDSDQIEEVPIRAIKAVFYVNTYEGDAEHNHLNFHSRAPVVQGIWMRLQFRDGEVMEGIVYNSLRYLVDPGFFLLPTDPESNNKLVYVVKSWLVDHRVLGMRKLQAVENESRKIV
jgi:hypothetical protein